MELQWDMGLWERTGIKLTGGNVLEWIGERTEEINSTQKTIQLNFVMKII